mgnify:CR=1 FL=1
MIKKILVPIDGSEHATKAIDLAADLAGKYKAEIVLFHVLLDHTSIYDLKLLAEKYDAGKAAIESLDSMSEAMVQAADVGYGGPISLPAPMDALRDVGAAIAKNAEQRVRSQSVDKIKTVISSGSAADAILEAAEGEGADMIVMGSRGLGKLAGMLMGSVSHKVSHHATCTVITVK